MNLADVLQVEVTSAARKSQQLSETAAAVYVISQEDIRRSGVTSIADALRLAPGLQVARDTSSSLAVSSRGFNGRYANKLLVLIDGRSVYTPIFSGVFWDLQDTLLEDIDRIEVIRGPGAAMWGANAVNGVINIITRPARKTQGNLLSVGAGDFERGFTAFRHGGQTDDGTYYRVYGKTFDRAATHTLDGQRAHDDWRSAQTGFRIDHPISSRDKLTLQGDAYQMVVGETVRSNTVIVPPYTAAYPTDDHAHGGNLLLRWESRQSERSETTLQTYVDRTHFTAPKLATELDTWDIDFQHRWRPDSRHDLVWGANARHINFAVKGAQEIAFSSQRQERNTFGVFAQDDIALIAERLRLTLGAKLERGYIGKTQFQPNLRLLWTPAINHTLWSAVSRAARTPSLGESTARIDYSMTAPNPAAPIPLNILPLATVINGNPDLQPEKLTAYEIGYRTRLLPRLTLDTTAFVNHYRNLIALKGDSIIPSASFSHLILPLDYYNEDRPFRTRGIELVVDWRPLDWMRLEGSYTRLNMDSRPIGSGLALQEISGKAAKNQSALRWQMDLPQRTQVDFWLRHSSGLGQGGTAVSAYTTLDLRLGWKPRRDLDLSLVGQNLLDRRHVEFSSDFAATSEIARSVYLKATWTF